MCKFVKPTIPAECSADERRAMMFEALTSLDLSDKCEKRNGLTYLSWANAWNEFKSAYPSATYSVEKNPNTGLPYFSDPNLGIMVHVEVTADGLTHEVWLPVLNSANKPMKEQPYSYQQWDNKNSKYVEKHVDAATVFDVNRAVWRGITKAIALHGAGLYLYQGEDVPNNNGGNDNSNGETAQESQVPAAPPKPYDRFATIKEQINSSADITALLSLYLDHQNEIEANPTVKSLFTQRKQQLQLLNPKK